MNGLSLAELAREIPGSVDIEGDAAVRVRGVHHDSRKVDPGDLFVAKGGAQTSGARFVESAESRGAAAVLAAKGALAGVKSALPRVLVDDVALGLAFSAAAVYGHPAFSLEIVGVTGTNGKTTVTHLVRAAIDGAIGAPSCGTIGTVGHAFGDYRVAAEHTTPEADEIARVLAAMRARGAAHVAMEVSSHALELRRVAAVRFRVAAFTNLTQDHLDYHGSMDAYAEAKARLFTELAPGAAVISVDDPFGRKLTARVRAPLLRVSARVGEDAEVVPESVSIDREGIRARVKTPSGVVDLRSRFVGQHNVENLVLALGIVCALDLDVTRAAAALSGEAGAPGRLERCDTASDDVTVFVDYAHTPDALVRALEAVKAITVGRVICVFGCGGDRDRAKRPLMGEAVARRADVAIVTNDNPRTEDPAEIARAVVLGIAPVGVSEIKPSELQDGARGYLVELDRARAIELAIAAAHAGDVILIAGKGHEDYQIIGTEKRAFDDRIEARRALAVRAGKVS